MENPPTGMTTGRPWFRTSSIIRSEPSIQPQQSTQSAPPSQPQPRPLLRSTTTIQPPQPPASVTPVSQPSSATSLSPPTQPQASPATTQILPVPPPTSSPESSPQVVQNREPPAPPSQPLSQPVESKQPPLSSSLTVPSSPLESKVIKSQEISSVPSSPQMKQSIEQSTRLNTKNVRALSPPPRTPMKTTPVQSPTTRSIPSMLSPPTNFPLSRLQPKPDPEPEPKSILKPVVASPKQKHVMMKENEKIEEPKRIGRSVNGVHDKDTKMLKKTTDDNEGNVRVITLAGENKGAYMELSSSAHKNGSKIFNDGERNQNSVSAEEKNKGNEKNKYQTTPMTAFVNSNVQSVNNSILFNSSCELKDPGVHLTLSRTPKNSIFEKAMRVKDYEEDSLH